jgi:hypothetical protein
MAGDSQGTFEAARGHAHRARKSAGRLAVSGLGFSVAYFFDPDHGSARRKQALVVANHIRRTAAQVKSRRGRKVAPTSPTTTARPDKPLPEGATNGSRASARS